MTLSQGIICHLGMRHWPSTFLPFSLWWQNCYPLIYDAAWSHQAGSFTVRSPGEHHWLATRSAPCLKSSCLGLGSPASTLPLTECPPVSSLRVCGGRCSGLCSPRLNSSGSLFIHFLQMLSWQKPFISLTRHIGFTNGFDGEHSCSNCPPLVRSVAIAVILDSIMG